MMNVERAIQQLGTIEPGMEYRLAIPAAVYTSVRSLDELRDVLDILNAEEGPYTLGLGDDGDTVLYMGWGEETIEVEDRYLYEDPDVSSLSVGVE